MEGELASLQARGVIVRGFQGEGSKALGNLFQVSNGATLGLSEADILTRLEEVTLDLVAREKQAREALLTRARTLLEDRIWRSFGVLRHARKLTAQETLQHGSMLRLGCHVQILELPRDVLDEILTLGQEAHTEFLAGGNGDAMQRSAWRAATIRRRLEGSQN
jgi:protein arginine kinase